jgi:hypothetical protein
MYESGRSVVDDANGLPAEVQLHFPEGIGVTGGRVDHDGSETHQKLDSCYIIWSVITHSNKDTNLAGNV